MADLRSVAERLEASQTDVSRAHDQLLAGMQKLAHKLYAAFEVERDPACAPFVDLASPDGAMRGSVKALTGPELDWVIDSWIGSPARGFSNHHLSIYLPSSVKVPHLAFAVGTIPQMFFFCDLIPRSDLWVNTAELDRYHAALNDTFLQVVADDRFTPFISRETYIRQAASPIAMCRQGPPTEPNIDFVMQTFEAMLDTWIPWVKEAEPTPLAERAALGARDQLVRKTICERDPANVVAEKVLGADITNQLVQLLAGTSRGTK